MHLVTTSSNMPFDSSLANNFAGIRTPFYYYDMALLALTLDAATAASGKHDYHVHYALKANANAPVLAAILRAGLGSDCVSGNEISRALQAGFLADTLTFAGVGKTDDEINLGLKHNIFSFNCESVAELEVINQLAAAAGTTARVALRINPNVHANTHHYITTGLDENKFGINTWELDAVLQQLKHMPHIALNGLHFHIGSQITDMSVFQSLCVRVNELNTWFQDRNIVPSYLNLGGGLGVDYTQPDKHAIPDFENYFGTVQRFLEPLPNQQVHFELGRSLVAQCGSLITRVLFVKKGTNTNFAIVDAGMTELIRPALYQSYHYIQNMTSDASEIESYDVVGPICESSDCFGKAVNLPLTKRHDMMAIRSTGAYGEVMASQYNLRDKVKSIYSDQL